MTLRQIQMYESASSKLTRITLPAQAHRPHTRSKNTTASLKKAKKKTLLE